MCKCTVTAPEHTLEVLLEKKSPYFIDKMLWKHFRTNKWPLIVVHVQPSRVLQKLNLLKKKEKNISAALRTICIFLNKTPTSSSTENQFRAQLL